MSSALPWHAVLAFGCGLVVGVLLTALWARMARRRRLLHRQAMHRLHKLREQARALERVLVAVDVAIQTGRNIYVAPAKNWAHPEEASRN